MLKNNRSYNDRINYNINYSIFDNNCYKSIKKETPIQLLN
jgi:hypothetical protein